MWSVSKEKRFPPRVNLADHIKMSRHRYQTILQYLTFADEPAAEDPVDLFWEVRPIIDSFNRNMFTYFTPGSRLNVDETVQQWYSSSTHLEHSMPYTTKLPHKPTTQGLECTTTACVESGLLLRMEPFEGKEVMATKQFNDKYQAHIALLLRAVAPWKSTLRTVSFDSRFGSVACITVLFRLFGLYARCKIKSNHSNSPKKIIHELLKPVLETKPRVSKSIFFTCAMPPLTLDEPGTFRSSPFMITCYLPRDFPLGVGPERLLVEGYCDKKISCFASSIGSGAPGLTQHRRVYHGLHGSVSEKLIDRSSLSEAYYQTSNTVDRHNQYSSLVTHGFAWHTQHYSHRVFGSVLSYITTNAFLAMKWERSSVNEQFEFSSFGDFVRALSFLAVGSPTIQFAPLASQASPAPSLIDTIALHKLECIPRGENSALISRKHCAFCKNGECRPLQYCAGCSNPADLVFVSYCHTKSKYTDGMCFIKHIIGLQGLPVADAASSL